MIVYTVPTYHHCYMLTLPSYHYKILFNFTCLPADSLSACKEPSVSQFFLHSNILSVSDTTHLYKIFLTSLACLTVCKHVKNHLCLIVVSTFQHILSLLLTLLTFTKYFLNFICLPDSFHLPTWQFANKEYKSHDTRYNIPSVLMQWSLYLS